MAFLFFGWVEKSACWRGCRLVRESFVRRVSWTAVMCAGASLVCLGSGFVVPSAARKGGGAGSGIEKVSEAPKRFGNVGDVGSSGLGGEGEEVRGFDCCRRWARRGAQVTSDTLIFGGVGGGT